VSSRYFLAAKAIGLLTILLSPLWISALLFSGDYDSTTAIGLVPLLIVVNLALLLVATRRDPLLRTVMIAGTVLKAAASGAAMFTSYRIYDTGADALHYFTVGQYLANGFLTRGEWPLMLPLWSTSLINTICGYLVLIIGPSMPAVFVLFSLFASWGCYFFYRAFCIAFPDGNRGAAALLLFFLPSTVYWTAAIGKDALIAFFLGLVAYGFARLRVRAGLRSYVVIGVGLLGVMAVRPHVAAMLGLAFLLPFMLAKNRRGIAGALYKAAGLLILLGAAVFFVTQASEFLDLNDFQKAPTTIEAISNKTRLGGSSFGATSSLPARAAMAPLLLFRPLPWEAHNLQSGVASLEGLILIVLVWRARKGIYRVVRGWRQQPYVLLIVIYGMEFSLAFSAAASNFGTLSRMRVMLLPFAIMLLCAPPVVMRAVAVRRQQVPGPLQRRPLPEPR